MKELIKIDTVKSKIGDVEINQYLSYAEIQAICNTVMKFDNWAERQENIDILLLHFTTNLTNEQIEEIGHDTLLKSGLIDEVKQVVKNYNRIQEAIDYTESTQRALAKIAKQLPELLKPLKDVEKRVNKSSKK